MDIESLIKAGFTYEELYAKGLLIAKPTENAGDPAPEPVDQNAAPVDPADPQPNNAGINANVQPTEQQPPAQDAVLSAINNLASEIKTAMQSLNRQIAERGGQPAQQMTLDDAINGLYKGV